MKPTSADAIIRVHRPASAAWTSRALRVGHMTFVAKVSERCNLACPYCYYYFMGDESWRDRPAFMTDEVFAEFLEALERFVDECSPKRVNFVFHGGEPMLMKPARFDQFCQSLGERLGGRTELRLAIQTNGAHMTPEWIALFARHRVHVGVSLDGPPEYQDAARPTNAGRPSSPDVERSIAMLQDAVRAGRIAPLGSITVLDAKHDIDRVLAYLRQDCGMPAMRFLLPDGAAQDPSFDDRAALRYGEILCRLFDESGGEARIDNREVMRFLDALQVRSAKAPGDEEDGREFLRSATVILQSDGTLRINEELAGTGAWRRGIPEMRLSEGSIRHFLSHPSLDYVRHMERTIPQECTSCQWKNACRGGGLHERRAAAEPLSGKSVYCTGLQKLYAHICRRLVAAGYPAALLASALEGAAAVSVEQH